MNDAFESLAMPLFASLYGYARWLTGEPHEAEDLVQETYLKALRGFGSFREGANFRAWMFRILRNTFLTSRAGLKAPASIDEEPELADAIVDEVTPESHFVNRANGEALGIPVGTVTSRLMRARQKVRVALEGLR